MLIAQKHLKISTEKKIIYHNINFNFYAGVINTDFIKAFYRVDHDSIKKN